MPWANQKKKKRILQMISITRSTNKCFVDNKIVGELTGVQRSPSVQR